MRKAAGHMVCRILVCSLLLLAAMGLQAQDRAWFDRKVKLKDTTQTRYLLLREISDKTGFLFVYDSQVVNNDVEVHIPKGEYTLREAIYAVTGNRQLQISLIGNNHILLHLPEKKNVAVVTPEEEPQQVYFTVTGTVYDLFSKEVISSATVSVAEAGLGTVTNRDGRFRITLPDSMRHATIRISHVGYENLEIPAASRAGQPVDFMLEPKVVSLQEVVVRVVNPRHTLEQMLQERPQNYTTSPVYLTAFYREGVEHKKRNVDLTEAVLKIYKQSYERDDLADQIKLIKKRRIFDLQERDTMITKVKSGIYSTLMLDVMKNEPDFLDIRELENPFVYAHTDVAVIDNRLANVISFEQKRGVKTPLYKGELFIDTENYALLEARFEVNPRYVEKATRFFVEKKSKFFNLSLRSAKYVVAYKPLADGKYCIHHVRGDLEFRVRRKRQLFSSTLKVWFELVNCKVETENVQPIPRSERLSTRTVFSETKHPYDVNFWGNFNVILPEEELRELILNNLTEVTESP